MGPLDVLDCARDTLWVTLKISMPILLVALIVGLVISILQALTQIQEMTLAFVPKILATFTALWLLMPLLGGWLGLFTRQIFHSIQALP